MQTYEEQLAFFKEREAQLLAAFTQGGPAAAEQYVLGQPDALERRVLFVFGRQALGRELPAPQRLDWLSAFADAGIAELLRQAGDAPDEETRRKRIDGANVVSFNLAADLADCWPEDSLPRERRHFERGLKAARDCIRWRTELDKGPAPFALAYWAAGMHELSLGNPAAAQEAFAHSLEHARQAARDAGLGDSLGAQGDFGVVLGEGYLALARIAAGQASARERYGQAIGAFTAQLENEERREDAQFGIDQLETVRRRYCKEPDAAAE